MVQFQDCANCVSLTSQCLELKEEICRLTKKLDNLINALHGGKEDFLCQYVSSSNSFGTQTDSPSSLTLVSSLSQKEAETQTETGVVSDVASPSIITDIFDNTPLSTSYQDSVLLDIFMDTNKTSSNPQQDTYSTPFTILPFVSVPNLPFAQFDFSQLNQETVFNTVFKNRSLAYFGENSYSYNGIKHNSNPIPVSDKYLCTILEHLRNVLPDFEYNSILISKYCDGTDSLGFHCDNELEIVEQSDIVTVSLGETRTAKFRALSGSGNSCPEQSLALEHGHCFVMSRLSQNYFQHSIIADNSQNPRISLTFRLLKPKPTLFTPPNPVAFPVSDISVNNVDVSPVESNNVSEVSEKITLYVGDSMFRHFSANKLSTSSQKAVVLSYPGATVNGVLAKLKTDPKFAEINPQHVQKIYLFCGTNNIDKTLNIPFHRNSDFIETGQFRASESAINSVKAEFSELVNFLHYWAIVLI